PERAGESEHTDAIGPVRKPCDRNRDETVEQREVQAADAPELPIGNLQLILDWFRQDRQQLPIQEIEYVDEAQHAENEPGSSIRPRGLRHRQQASPKNRSSVEDQSCAAASSRSGW